MLRFNPQLFLIVIVFSNTKMKGFRLFRELFF